MGNAAIPEVTISKGLLIRDTRDDHAFRVIYVSKDYIVLCETGTKRLNVFGIASVVTFEYLEKGIFEILPDEHLVVELTKLPEKAMKKYQLDCAMIKVIEDNYGPDFQRLMGHAPKSGIKNFLENANTSKNSVWRKIRRYLQSGCDLTSLIDRRYISTKTPGKKEPRNYTKKTGRKPKEDAGIIITEKEKKQFDIIRELYLKSRRNSISNLHIELINRFYCTTTVDEFNHQITKQVLPKDQRPTENQLRYFINQNMTDYDKEVRRTSQCEARNNRRILKSDTLFRTRGPMDLCQIDECEIDIELVADIAAPVDYVIGRPVVYILQDTFTKMILSIGIGFENNSVIGLTNCLMNLSDDKAELCKKYNIGIADGMWPSGYLPHRIISDRGAEYLSDEATRICTALNITKELAPAATGSLKGDVERFFGQAQTGIRPYVEKCGEINRRHDSNHKKTAKMTIYDFTKMLLNFVVTYNSKQIENYPIQKNLIEAGITSATPLSLWKYGMEQYGEPNRIINKEQFLLALMQPVSVSITRKGYRYKGLYYRDWNNKNLEIEILNNMGKNKKREFYLDPRDIGRLYFVEDGKLANISLNDERAGNADFAGMTLREWEIIYKQVLGDRRNAKDNQLNIEIALQDVQRDIIQRASAMSAGIIDSKNMREHRFMEQQRTRNENSMYSRLCETPALPSQRECLPEKEEVAELEEMTSPDMEMSAEDIVRNLIADYD